MARDRGPRQLQMFMQFSDLADAWTSDIEWPETRSEMWDRKAAESGKPWNQKTLVGRPSGAGVYDAMKQGVDLPPVLLTIHRDGVDYISDGHHRIAAARDLGRHFPVRYTE